MDVLEILDDNKYYYYGNSKKFEHVDPEMRDPHSIQNASCYRVYLLVKDKSLNKWIPPVYPLPMKNTFDMAKDIIYRQFTERQMGLTFMRNFPGVVYYEEFSDQDLRINPICRKLKGRKVFMYEMIHDYGNPQLNENLHEDFAWVPVPHMHKYLDEDLWKQLRPYMAVF